MLDQGIDGDGFDRNGPGWSQNGDTVSRSASARENVNPPRAAVESTLDVREVIWTAEEGAACQKLRPCLPNLEIQFDSRVNGMNPVRSGSTSARQARPVLLGRPILCYGHGQSDSHHAG